MTSEVGTTLSTPFIFLRPRNRRDVPPKKALMTTTVQSLLKVACRLFKNYGEVKAIYTESGELVKEITQIIPSATYYVTSISPDFTEEQDNTGIAPASPEKTSAAQSPGKINSSRSLNKLFGDGMVFTPEYRQLQEQQIRQEEQQRAKEEEERQKKEQEALIANRKKFTNKKAEERKKSQNSKQSSQRTSTAENDYEEPQNNVVDYEYDDYYYDDDYASPIKTQRAGKTSQTQQSGKKQLITPQQLRKKRSEARQRAASPMVGKEERSDANSEKSKKSQISQVSSKSQVTVKSRSSRSSSPTRSQKTTKSASYQRTEEAEYDYYDYDDYGYYDYGYYDYEYQSPAKGQRGAQQGRKSAASASSRNSTTPTRAKLSAARSSPRSKSNAAAPERASNASELSAKSSKSYSRQNTMRRSPKKQERPSIIYDEEEDQLQQVSDRGVKRSSNKQQKTTKRSTKVNIIDEEEDGDFIYEKKPTNRRSSPSRDDRQGNFSLKDSQNGEEDSEENLRRSQEILELDEANDQFIFEDNGPRHSSLDQMIKDILGVEDIPKPFIKAIRQMKIRDRNFVKTCPYLESLQEENWFRLNLQNIKTHLPMSDNIAMKELLSSISLKHISKHRFPLQSGCSYIMKSAIVGPRHSGKSTFLSILAENLLCDLVATNTYKHMFVVAINILAIRGSCQSYESLYSTIVDICIDSLSAQRPIIQEYLPQIRKLFNSVVKTAKNSPSIPMASKLYQDQPVFSQALAKIAKTVWMAYNDESALAQFLTTVFLMPRMFAAAAGFSDVFMVIDNFDYATFDINDSSRFIKSSNAVHLEEYWKFCLSVSNFVVSCENEVSLFSILPPLVDGGIDLSCGLDIVSTVGMADDTDDGVLIKVDIDGHKKPFTFTRSHCGGIVAFVNTWDELNEEFSNYESTPDDNEEKEEMNLMLVSMTQAVIDDLFVSPNPVSDTEAEENAILVTGVRRELRK